MSILEVNRPWSNEIKERVKNADNDEIMKYFEDLSAKWTVSKGNSTEEACKRLNITSIDGIDTSVLQVELEKAIFEATLVYTKFKKCIEDFEEYSSRWDKLYEVIFYSERLIRDIYLLFKTCEPGHNSLSNEDPDVLFKYTRFTDDSKKTPYQCLLLYFLETISEEGFTKCGGNLYKPLIKYGNNTIYTTHHNCSQ